MLTVINGALQNENETLRHDQSSAGRPSAATDAELHELQEEFTRRIAAADRTIASLKVHSRHLLSHVIKSPPAGSSVLTMGQFMHGGSLGRLFPMLSQAGYTYHLTVDLQQLTHLEHITHQ